MNYKYLIPYCLFLVLFGVVSVMVYANAGKSSFFLAKKLKIGGILLIMASFLWVSGLKADERIEVMCYEIEAVNILKLEKATGRILKISEQERVVQGSIVNPDRDSFQYQVLTKKSKIIANGSFTIKKSTSSIENNFIIIFDSTLPKGEYKLEVFYIHNKKKYIVGNFTLLIV